MSVLNHLCTKYKIIYLLILFIFLKKNKTKKKNIQYNIITTLKFSIWLNNKIKIKQK